MESNKLNGLPAKLFAIGLSALANTTTIPTNAVAGDCPHNICEAAKTKICMDASRLSDQIAKKLSELISKNPDARIPGTAAFAECETLRVKLDTLNSMRSYCGSIGGPIKIYKGGKRIR